MTNIVTLSNNIATIAHHNQIRKMGQDKGKPYIIHPQRIAKQLYNPTLKCIALLHDTIEDSFVTPTYLDNEGIPKDIIQSVITLTKLPYESYITYITRILYSKDNNARIVKINDLCDNILSLPDGSRKDKYQLAKYILTNNNT